jgi:hypothetical protein
VGHPGRRRSADHLLHRCGSLRLELQQVLGGRVWVWGCVWGMCGPHATLVGGGAGVEDGCTCLAGCMCRILLIHLYHPPSRCTA